jgi:hypothetical protein
MQESEAVEAECTRAAAALVEDGMLVDLGTGKTPSARSAAGVEIENARAPTGCGVSARSLIRSFQCIAEQPPRTTAAGQLLGRLIRMSIAFWRGCTQPLGPPGLKTISTTIATSSAAER